MVMQKAIFLAVLYTLIIGSVIIMGVSQTETDYPPREDFKRAYKTVYQRDWVCWECHTKPIGYGL